VGAAFRRCRAALFNELGVEPSQQTRRLYDRLAQSEELVTANHGSPDHRADAPAPPAPGTAPFLGLQRFTEADADRFYGRERLTGGVLGRLLAEPFLAVIGASGSGKSSLVRAGVLPALRQADGGDVRLFTPTSRPLEALAVTLLGAGVYQAEQSLLLGELSRDPGGLRRHLRGAGGGRLALFVDQFEELFTLCRDGFEAEAFVETCWTPPARR